ncbi:MAG TPA: FkbM family methyltransferase [Candidatus Babeliales bacterium]|nr:FkbM family methyltransferase [Candidatus Babeliales bacterium]
MRENRITECRNNFCISSFIFSLILFFRICGYPYLQPFAPYYSQCGQDKYINEILFHNKKKGTFIDIGAHDGVSYSNTYYFEKVLGWSGICVEPHPDRFAELKKNRTAVCIQACISNFSGTADFLKISGPPEMLSGLVDAYESSHQQRINYELQKNGGTSEIIQVSIRILDDVLKEHGLHHIDLLCIDTEGSEENIIKSIDFSAYDIDVIIVENNYNSLNIRNYLTEQGYRYIVTLDSDEIYKKKLTIALSRYEKNILNTFAESAYSTRSTVYHTYALARECILHNIAGDFIECGVAAGAQIAAMAHAGQSLNVPKKIHLFDSFQGIPLAGLHDTQQPGIGAITHDTQVHNVNDLLVSSGISVCSVENVKINMARWNVDQNFLRYHVGWFQHTLPSDVSSIEKISLLRLDGDLYESTKVCLEYLYPKIVKGGYIVIDDYALAGCRKAVQEYLTLHNLHPYIMVVPQEKKEDEGPVYWQIL